jgi:hypothetical protein
MAIEQISAVPNDARKSVSERFAASQALSRRDELTVARRFNAEKGFAAALPFPWEKLIYALAPPSSAKPLAFPRKI